MKPMSDDERRALLATNAPMSADIVEQLRANRVCPILCAKAADEIERLRAQLNRLYDYINEGEGEIDHDTTQA